MKTAEEWRKQWVFGKCPGEAHGHVLAGASLHCGKCLEEAFAACQREALEEAAKVAASLGGSLNAREDGCGYCNDEVALVVAERIRYLSPSPEGEGK